MISASFLRKAVLTALVLGDRIRFGCQAWEGWLTGLLSFKNYVRVTSIFFDQLSNWTVPKHFHLSEHYFFFITKLSADDQRIHEL